MSRKDIVNEEYGGTVIQHVGSKLKFAIDNPDGRFIVEDTIFMDEGTVLNVCSSVWVQCAYESSSVEFYVQDVKDIPQLFELVKQYTYQPHVGMTIEAFNEAVK